MTQTFKSKEELDKYTEQFKDRFTAGEIQTIDSDVYMWTGDEWNQITVNADNTGISMSIYNLNEQIISQLPDYSEEELQDSIKAINEFNKNTNSKAYMLLCKEASYYTVFIQNSDCDFTDFGEGVIECVQDLGHVRSVENIDNNEIEIWVYDMLVDNMYCLHLFDYQRGIVYYGE